MKTIHYILFGFLSVLLSAAHAGKPDGAGRGNPGKETGAAHREMGMKASEEAKSRASRTPEQAGRMAGQAEGAANKRAEAREQADRAKAQANEAKGAAAEAKAKGAMKAGENSNASDKTDAVRKEAGKGSETGQAKREEKSRKWWRFWGE